MKKMLVTALAVIILLTLTAGVQATNTHDDSIASDIVVGVAEDFLTAYLKNAYLYADESFDELTISSVSEEDVKSTIDYAGKTIIRAELKKNIDFIKAKNTYWQYVRKAQNIHRTDFNVDYHVQDIKVSNKYATVVISAMMSFKYSDSVSKEVSYKEDIFTIDLLEVGNRWVVVDAYEPLDWFDSTYKYNDNFDLDVLLSEYVEEDTLSLILRDYIPFVLL